MDVIDWSREPLTDREQKVRAAVIRRTLERYGDLPASLMLKSLADFRDDVATDLATAIANAQVAERDRIDRRRRDDLLAAIEEVDGS